MEHLRMASRDLVQDNVEAIGKLFPNCIKEVQDSGDVYLSIDFDALKQELSHSLIEGRTERYEFNWPGKRASALLANTPIEATLRPCREESVNFDTTENLYIEGDNLDVLKLLCDNYRGKINLIYFDPPYNTGNDFIYEDNFIQKDTEYKNISDDYDNQGNRLRKNTDTSGRFHTDWLNMMYSRLKVAKKLLIDNGVIFISIDDNEISNLRKICDDIFGDHNFVAIFPWRKRTAKSDVPFGVSQDYEWIIMYANSKDFLASIEGKERKYYETPDFPGKPWRFHDMTTQRTAMERPNCFFTIVNPKNGKEYPANPNRVWANNQETFYEWYKNNRIIFPDDYDFLNIDKPVIRYWKSDDEAKAGENFGKIAVSTKLPENTTLPDKIGMSQDGTKEITDILGKVFSYPKPTSLIHYLLKTSTQQDSIILDFFSGSATTAHAVIQLNAEDGGKRKFIMVQIPEECPEGSEAAKAGYKNICEIGKERIRRAGKKIADENATNAPNLDIGFRVLKLDSSNMADVYYRPSELKQGMLNLQEDNVKPGRTAEDLLFQVMLEKDIPLSSKIETEKVAGKTIFNVADGYLLACFDKGVTDDVVTAIAKKQPVHAVFRDAGMATDSTAINFDQIFENYSPDTKRSIL